MGYIKYKLMRICWLLLFLSLHFLACDSSFVLRAGTVMSVFPSLWCDCVAEVDFTQHLYESVFNVPSGRMGPMQKTSCFEIVHLLLSGPLQAFSKVSLLSFSEDWVVSLCY